MRSARRGNDRRVAPRRATQTQTQTRTLTQTQTRTLTQTQTQTRTRTRTRTQSPVDDMPPRSRPRVAKSHKPNRADA